ncbi:MAG: single-stranded DNA-binding protein [Actinobacteria bacterium]|nr:single-stranded DNA-binding protein [Actinomycetota bacterium]
MRSINRSTLEGNLTHDVDLRRLPSGSPVATLRVGFNTSQRTENGWGDLQRGSYVLIDGHLESQNWTDREGNRRHRVFVVADLVRWPSGQPARLREEAAVPLASQQAEPQSHAPAPAAPPAPVAQPLTINDSPVEHQTAPDPAASALPPVRPLDDAPTAPEPPGPAGDPVGLGTEGAIPITPADLPF